MIGIRPPAPWPWTRRLKVYEVKPGIWDHNGAGECDTSGGGGNPLFHFVLNDCIALDNRIPPKGFTGGTDIETRPVNYSYPETAPGSGILVNYDDTSYTVPIPPSAAGDLTVEATLRYQTASDDYVEFLLDQALANNFPDDCIPRSTGLPDMSRGEILHACGPATTAPRRFRWPRHRRWFPWDSSPMGSSPATPRRGTRPRPDSETTDLAQREIRKQNGRRKRRPFVLSCVPRYGWKSLHASRLPDSKSSAKSGMRLVAGAWT